MPAHQPVCSQCGQTFTRAASLKRHIRYTHEDDRPYHCQNVHCRDKPGFRRRDELEKHDRHAHRAAPRQCPICLKEYSSGYDYYTKHIRQCADKVLLHLQSVKCEDVADVEFNHDDASLHNFQLDWQEDLVACVKPSSSIQDDAAPKTDTRRWRFQASKPARLPCSTVHLQEMLQRLSKTTEHVFGPTNTSLEEGGGRSTNTLLHRHLPSYPLIGVCQALEEELCRRKTVRDVNAVSNGVYTALSKAVVKDQADTVEALLDQGADANVTNENGATSLRFAASQITDAVDDQGATSLFTACERSDEVGVERLLRRGADANLGNLSGTTPLYHAVSNGSLPIVKSLLKGGPDRSKADVNLPGDPGRRWRSLAVALRKNYWTIAALLLENGADVTFTYFHLDGPLHLLSHKINFWHVSEKRRIEVEKYRRGCSARILTDVFSEPLSDYKLPKAIEASRLRVGAMLLVREADATARNFHGHTPLDAAKTRGDTSIIRLFSHHARMRAERQRIIPGDSIAATSMEDIDWAEWDRYFLSSPGVGSTSTLNVSHTATTRPEPGPPQSIQVVTTDSQAEQHQKHHQQQKQPALGTSPDMVGQEQQCTKDLLSPGAPRSLHSPSFHSLSYLSPIEANLKDYVCCGRLFDSMHELLQHHEQAHAAHPTQTTGRTPTARQDPSTRAANPTSVTWAASKELAQTESQAYQDELYKPSTTSTSSAAATKADDDYLSPHRNLVSKRLQNANIARSHSPMSSASRLRSPFKDHSPLAPPAAAGMRQQQKEQADRSELAQHEPRMQRLTTGTISPKDALLDYNEQEQVSLLFDTIRPLDVP